LTAQAPLAATDRSTNIKLFLSYLAEEPHQCDAQEVRLASSCLIMSFDNADSAEVSAGQNALALMQPTFIRVMDHLRRTLEQSDWKGQYETTYAWPEGITPKAKAEVLRLYDKIEAAPKSEQADLEGQLEALPQPIPIYLLHLEKGEEKRMMNLWELCYQICLAEYEPQIESMGFANIPLNAAMPDQTLFDTSGEVDWVQLDQKTDSVIQAAFESLEHA
jgi:hypothetical protein